ncbi:zinc-binding alcohol dehydrogenase family protein [Paracoccus sp. TOH]|uniref:quinone oxidoreductase family protein n=1 Tax=Paracoccus sp. TOH TaxID=1263728 RepID=UPI0025B1AEE4|nr:zinc-binding alcohol dehydrogenase family protein [Paracoccus sp. TOH]WJS85418.1 zinc-binding alcohol dehydrogenase family protein [Paracoccus sp. TOH]
MRAAIVSMARRLPALGELSAPVASAGEKLIQVNAAAISHVVKARASGEHYSTDEQFPFVVGIDGVGRLEDGGRVYFALPRPPFGSMADYTVADARLCVPVPDDLDDFTAAAIANPGMSCWVALTERAQLKPGETVLINGATGTSGRLAIQIAKLLGAGRIIATGRNVKALGEAKSLGADVTIQLGEDAEQLEHRFMHEFAQGVDIVIDYLWGHSAECLLIAAAKAGRDAVPMRFVQVGSVSASDITLPSSVLRASAIELMGSGHGSVPVPRLVEITGEVLRATVPSNLTVAFKPVPFADFDQAWPLDNSTCRTVFAMNAGRT